MDSRTATRGAGRVIRLVLLGALAAALLPGSAHAVRCPQGPTGEFTCTRVTVPLDRTGGTPGSVHLFVERSVGPEAPGTGALFALAGGPGQAATPFAEDFGGSLGPLLRDRDLIVFDERGTGLSGPLGCRDNRIGNSVAPLAVVAGCAQRLGARRGFYTTRDSADEIEAVRQSIGVDKIELYGVSYGTYTALTYARRYPQHVEALILDSTVPPDGTDPFDRARYGAVPQMLRDTCAGTACRNVTPDPVADLDRLVPQLVQAPRLAVAFDSRGGPQLVRLTADRLHDMIFSADLDPLLAAELPSLLRSAANGDYAALARAVRDAQRIGDGPILDDSALSPGTYLARLCEEATFPWPRTAPLSERPGDLSSAIEAVPPSAFSPWERQTEVNRGTSAECLGWPAASAASPQVDGPLPDVPALILSGADAMRTPLATAQQVASLLPRATIVSIPHEGHSLLGTSRCADVALEQFSDGRPVKPCTRERRLFSPLPLAPRSVRGLPPTGGATGRAGRTLTAVEGAFDDAFRGFLLHLVAGDVSASHGLLVGFGGLRGGFVRLEFRHGRAIILLHRDVYVPGVRVSAAIRVTRRGRVSGRIVVQGRDAARGTLRIGRDGGLTGRLGGPPLHAPLAGASAAAAHAAGVLDSPLVPPAIRRALGSLG